MTRREPRAAVISPFASESVRQWPAPAHRAHLARTLGIPVMIVGTRGQRAGANDLARGLSSSGHEHCGALRWEELVEAADATQYVVANH
jgi:hypothetical protein